MFTPNIVLRKLIKLNTKSAGGPDGVPLIFLKRCAHVRSHSLAFLFEHSFNSCVLPVIWLHAYITPIFKKGDSTSPANYRPISLTCTTCKIMESIIKDAMSSALLTANLITKQQHAFISKHSTTSNLLECTSDWSLSLNHKIPVDVIYIDFARAFDSVVHAKLLYKLYNLIVPSKSITWI